MSVTTSIQLDGVSPDPLRDTRSQPGLRDDINVAFEELLKVHQQPAEIKQSAPLVEIDDVIDIARFRNVGETPNHISRPKGYEHATKRE